jgi:RNA polymerase sigma-70 factor (ECF subfamily)
MWVVPSNLQMRDDAGLSDEDVVARVRSGDTAVFEILMRRYNQRLFRAARAILRDDADAEDAVQQAYLAAYAHLDQFAGTARFSTWLTRIAIREALGKLRTRKRRGEVELDVQQEETMMKDEPDESPEQYANRRELSGILEAAVDGLPEIYRVVFMMREVEQLSTSECADVLELSEEAVKVRLHRARAMLRDGLFAKVDKSLSSTFPFLGPRCDRIVAAVMAKLPPRRPLD